MPQALLRTGPSGCREEADQRNWDRSPRLFNNATKQDRYRAPASVEPARPNMWASTAAAKGRCGATPINSHRTSNSTDILR